MSDATVCLIILVAVVALFIWNRLPVELVAVGSGLALWATGVLPFAEVFAGFGDPVIPFVAGLFVVSEGLNVAGVTAWLGRQLVLRAGDSPRRLLAATMLLAAVLAALISVNGATAALLPMVVLLAVRLGRSPAGLAMPVAFAGHAGSLLLLTATPINLLVSEGAVAAGGRAFGFAEYALVGVPLVVGTIAVTVGLGDRLLPARTPRSLPPDLGGHARTLIRHYELDAHAAGLRVGPRSDMSTLEEPGIVVFGAVTADHLPRGDAPPRPGDILVVRGPEGLVHAYADRRGLAHVPRDVSDKLATILLNNELGVAEVVLGPRSALVGDT
ncbi:MAG: SLC13 family permease, partial [Catenulispora sp.]|nr:SLC13 family permease [Catenulispora sp.]